jgi:hypothetical protein
MGDYFIPNGATTAQAALHATGGAYAVVDVVNATKPVAYASGDSITIWGIYEED